MVTRHVVLLRGINLARHNRIAMSDLRSALEADGSGEVVTYLQSGNVVLNSRSSPARVASDVNALIKKRFGFDIAVLVRSHAELAAVVRCNPFASVAVDPKRYMVTFTSAVLPVAGVARLQAVVAPQDPFAVIGREIYSWHPAGFGRSPLWERLSARTMGIAATSRNWSTVTALLGLAGRPTAR